MTRRVLNLKMDGYVSRGRLKIRWMDCVKDDRCKKSISMDETSNRENWKRMRMHIAPTPDNGRKAGR